MNQVMQHAENIRITLHVLPNALVAWADGRLDEHERSLIERIAEDARGPSKREPHGTRGPWLDRAPSQAEVETWVRLVRAFLRRVPSAARERFVAQTKENLWLVARVSGAPASVCPNERAVIARIEQILHTVAA